MCHDWRQEYTECCHVSRKLIHCPTYHKQQKAAKGFLGRLFCANLGYKKDCGRVIPHYAHPEPYCPDCTIKIERLRAEHVGGGAFKVYRPAVDDDWRSPFKEYREKRRQAARESLENPDKYTQHVKESRDRVESMSNSPEQPQLWIPNLYDQPQLFARKEAFGRPAEAAPPVSYSKRSKHSAVKTSPLKEGKGEVKWQPYAPKSRKRHERKTSIIAAGISDSGRSHLFERPREPPQKPPSSHATLPVPRPPTIRRDTSKVRPEQKHHASSHEPLFSTHSESTKIYPALRRKPGRTFSITRQKEPSPLPVPPPTYRVYLDALEYASGKNLNPDTNSIAKSPRFRRPRKRKKSTNSKELSRSASVLRRVAKFRSISLESEESFACQHSKWLAMNQTAPPSRKNA